jgi:transcriptional regulator with PAS, ATPase and Fis domain
MTRSAHPDRLPRSADEEEGVLARPARDGGGRSEEPSFSLLLDLNPRMAAVRATIKRVAPIDVTVLVWGESGVGKELVARALHEGSPRRAGPFVKVNCAALPFELLESELFGYERGAFTGASRQKPGKFELAHGGSIFLDEIGEIAMPVQAKLLQVLQDGEFARLGSQSDIRVDVRVIAATNKDLGELVQDGRFREDLYYRLNVMAVHVPPLRERREEIPVLVERFLAEFASEYGRSTPVLSTATRERLLRYPWPGNVRELENAVRRIVVLGSDACVAEDLRTPVVGPGRDRTDPLLPLATATGPASPVPPAPVAWQEGEGLRDIARRAAEAAEGLVLQEVLDRVRWNRLEAARRLRVSYKTLLTKMKLHGLD